MCGAFRAPHIHRNGAFAHYLTLSIANLHPVPDSLPTEITTFTEPVAAALEIQTQIAINPGDRVVVVGDGKLGQLIAQTLALTSPSASRFYDLHPRERRR
jgi:threonine dehydrogenase-like Zn-dependent dehydrogenase